MSVFNKRLGTNEHVGMVLHIRGTFRMDTSMDEVLIWNPLTKSSFVEYISGDTFAEVDASEEVKLAYRQSIIDHQKHLDSLNAENLLKSIRVGSEVLVVRGRKVPKGKSGVVSKIYDNGTYKTLVLDDGTRVYDNNVQVKFGDDFIEPEIYIERTFFFQAI